MRTKFVLLWLALAVVAFCLGRLSVPTVAPSVEWRVDTVRVVQPEVHVVHTRGKMQVRVDTVYRTGDTVYVELPQQQAEYLGEDYRAYVSGYRPVLDSLILERPTRVVEVPEKQRRWSIGIQGGYGITPAGPQPYLGIGFTFRLL